MISRIFPGEPAGAVVDGAAGSAVSASKLARAGHHLEVQPGHRGESSALDEDPAPPDRLRSQERRAIDVEEQGRREADPHEVQAQQPVVDAAEGGAAHVDPVDLQPLAADGVQQRLDQLPGFLPVVEGGVDQVHPQPAHGVLLQGVGGIEQPDVEQDVARRGAYGMLEPQAHPDVALVAPLE